MTLDGIIHRRETYLYIIGKKFRYTRKRLLLRVENKFERIKLR